MPDKTLRNARIKKDADGDYYLVINTSDGRSAMLNLTALNPDLNEQIRNEINPQKSMVQEIVETWIAEQDASLVRAEDEFPDEIE